jgi:hypothetical protein
MIAQMVQKLPVFKEPEGSLQLSEDIASKLYPELVESCRKV